MSTILNMHYFKHFAFQTISLIPGPNSISYLKFFQEIPVRRITQSFLYRKQTVSGKMSATTK